MKPQNSASATFTGMHKVWMGEPPVKALGFIPQGSSVLEEVTTMKCQFLKYILPLVSGFVILFAYGQGEDDPAVAEQQISDGGYALPNSWEKAEERLALRDAALNKDTREYLSRYLESGWKCLEIGPGNGSITRWIASKVGKQGSVTAIDIDPLFEVEESSNIGLITADFTNYSFADNHYDLIFARDVMQHVKGGDKEPVDFQQIVMQLEKALRPGGLLIFEGVASWGEVRHFYGRDDHPDVVKLEKSLAEQARYAMDFELADKHPYHFKNAGLKVLDGQRMEKTYEGGSDYMKMMLRTLEQIKERGILRVAEDEQEAYEKLIALYQNPDYLFWSQGRVWAVGQKPMGVSGKNEL